MMDPESVKKYNHNQRIGYFFRKGNPVGPFDPNEIMDKNLLRGFKEVMKGDLSLPSRGRSRYQI